MPPGSVGRTPAPSTPPTRILRQWEIYDFPVPEGMVHPCVIISPDAICLNAAYEQINILLCTSLRPGSVRTLKSREVRLNGADGLDGPTIVKCHNFLYEYKSDAGSKRGVVCHERRIQIQRAIRESYGLLGS